MKAFKYIGLFFLLTLLLAGCGDNNSGTSPGDFIPDLTGPDSNLPDPPPVTRVPVLEPGGPGLDIKQVDDGQGGTVAANFTAAVGINDLNQIIGIAEVTSGTLFRAAYWTVDTLGEATLTPASLSPLSGNDFSAAFAIDGDGKIVGQSGKGAKLVAVFWPEGSRVPQELPPLTFAGNSAAFGISDDGSLVVGQAQDAVLNTRPVIWVADALGDFTASPVVLPVNLFQSGGIPSSYGAANGVARVAGEIFIAGEVEDGQGANHAVLWRSADGTVFTATDLRRGGETGSVAFAVNQSGQVVGESEAAAGTFMPVMWAEVTENNVTELKRTDLAAAGSAMAINANGRIAGSSGAAEMATVWNGTTPSTLFNTTSQAFGLNNSDQPLVVGRNGGQGFIVRLE